MIIEGPFARNRAFLTMLDAASFSFVIPMDSATGTSQGAALLIAASRAQQGQSPPFLAADQELKNLCRSYASEWNAQAGKN